MCHWAGRLHYTEQFWKGSHTVLPSLFGNYLALPLETERSPSLRHFHQRDAKALSYLRLSLTHRKSP